MNRKTRRLITTLIAIFSLIFQSVAPAAIFASELTSSDSAEVATEVATPTPEVTEAPSPTPEIIPTPAVDPQAPPSGEPTIGAPVVPTPTPIWIIAADGTATTSTPAILEQKYEAPQRSGVSVTFTKLPDNYGYLSVKEINLTEEERAAIGAISTTGYEITSTMENGSFTYNLTLPYVDDNDDGVVGPDSVTIDSIGVAASQDGNDYVRVDQLAIQKEQKLVEITNLDHFTVFVLVNDIDTDNPNNLGDSDDVANGAFSQIDDAYADQNDPNDDHGGGTEIHVRSDSPNDNKRGFIKFDVSPVDEDALITKATLRLYLNDAPSSSRNHEAYRLTENWDEDTLSWNTGPDAIDSATATAVTGTTNNVWVEWDVTEDVRGFLDGAFSNFGWMIKDLAEEADPAREGQYNSSEHATELRRPQLVVDFALSDDQPTEYNSPSNQELVVVGDDENGFETDPTNAFLDGGGFASNINGDDDAHLYYDYNFTVSGESTINGIEVRADWYLDDEAGTNSLDVALSWNGGTNWTSAKSDATETDKEHISSLGGASDTWERDWSPSEFSNDNFRVRVSSNTSSSSRDFFLDWIPVRVYYTPLTTGTLVVKKHVDNDNGGLLAADEFNLHVSAGGIEVLGSPAAGDENGVSYTLEAGDYEVSEDSVSGYSSSFSGDCDSGGAVAVVAGETKTCTITNDDQPARLILVKNLPGDNGGTATEDDFPVYIDDEEADWGENQVDAGSYTVSEDTLAGYAASGWGEDCDDDGLVTLDPGETKTCTITNDDEPASLTVIKQVINDDGGSATAADFSITVTGTDVSDSEFPGDENGTTVTLDAGEYSVDEEEVPGYEKSFDEGCFGTLVNGESRICTITNDDIAPVLALVKEVVIDNGGQEDASSWTLIANGIDGSFSGAGPTVGPNAVFAGVEYTLEELGPDGYTASSWQCDGGFLNGSRLTLEPGDNLTCTIVNDDQPGEIHGVKFEDENGNGEWDQGEEGLSRWTIYADINDNGEFNDGEPSDETGDDGQYSLTGLAAGTYEVREIVKDGWTQTTANPDPIELENGEVIEEINFGNFELFTISGKKFNDLNGDGARTDGDSDPNLVGWTIQLDLVDNDSAPTCDTGLVNGEFCELVTDEFGNYSFENLGPGEYRVTEVLQDVWLQTAPTAETGLGGQDDGSYLVSGSSGVDRGNRNFGNFELGRIRGAKFNDANGNGVRDEGEPGLSDWTIYLDVNENGQLDDGEAWTTTDEDGWYEFTGLLAGIYRVREVLQDGWTQTRPESGEYVEEVTSGSLFEDRDFGNFEDVTIIVYKWEDWDGDGEWDENEPAAEGWEIGLAGNSTEILELNLTGATNNLGAASFTVTQPGTYRLTEDSRTNWQRTYPADSFFDIFADLGGAKISHDKDGNELWFGNILFEDIFGGMFAPTNGNVDATPGATILGDSTITVPEDGANTIFFPDGTVITRNDGENFDISDLSGSSVALGSLTGLGSGVVADGALQWGLVDLGLEFSQPITVNIFVGTSFNGQTLNVVRSTSGTGGWTNDGIVAPTTCTVVDGFCTFQATKASFYAATHTTSTGTTSSTSSTSSSGGGGGGTTVCSDAKPASGPQLLRAVAGSNTVTLTWSEAGDPVTYYLVAYGTTSGTLTYGNSNIGGKGTTSYTVGSLSGGTTYYFRVRAGNGCTPGDYSNEIAATPGGGFVAGPAAGFAEGVLGVETEVNPEVSAPTSVLTPFLTPKPTAGKVLGQEAGRWSWWWLLLIIPIPAAILWWWSRR